MHRRRIHACVHVDIDREIFNANGTADVVTVNRGRSTANTRHARSTKNKESELEGVYEQRRRRQQSDNEKFMLEYILFCFSFFLIGPLMTAAAANGGSNSNRSTANKKKKKKHRHQASQ
ncbi:uncharacterized protein LOC105199285 [Solenopsis invicta]|uniref:uncharacterized protein LOC105199285 n=1 Tax=Solenopsis invicta TaxID=13686 RepID=UPI000E33F069|nr:uncharacterized protein LOC105199285 [Solenopsis invicta]